MREDLEKMAPVMAEFQGVMATRLAEKTVEGFMGWDNQRLRKSMEKRMIAKAANICSEKYDARDYASAKKDLIDIAAFAMFLWNLTCDRERKERELYA